MDDVELPLFAFRMQEIQTLVGEAVAAQLVET
jgi:hypothetical protein